MNFNGRKTEKKILPGKNFKAVIINEKERSMITIGGRLVRLANKKLENFSVLHLSKSVITP